LMFFSTMTHVRFFCVLPLAGSCVFAYGVSSSLLGMADPRCAGEGTWAWPAILLLVVTVLALTGHASVEYHRRLNFLSLYASYAVLSQAHEDDLENLEWTVTQARGLMESRGAKLKRALDLLCKFSTAAGFGSIPLRAALKTMIAVLETCRADIAKADMMLAIDAHDQLRQCGVGGAEREALLMFLDAPPPLQPDVPAANVHASHTHSLSTSLHRQAWGWNVLSSSSKRPLAVAADELLLPAVAAAADVETGAEGIGSARAAAEVRCRAFVQAMLKEYSTAPPAAEARAALALRAAHWLAERLGLWQDSLPWEKVALLVAATGLHCAAGQDVYIFAQDPLLARAACVYKVLEALDSSGLGKGGQLRGLTRTLIARTRPRDMVDAARWVRVKVEMDDQFPSCESESAVLRGLVLSAADLAYLALPPHLHQQWAQSCEREAQGPALVSPSGFGCSYKVLHDKLLHEASLDLATWLRGLVEVLALPIYQSLGALDQRGVDLAVPVKYLRENATHWRTSIDGYTGIKLSRVTQRQHPETPNENQFNSIIRLQGSLHQTSHDEVV